LEAANQRVCVIPLFRDINEVNHCCLGKKA